MPDFMNSRGQAVRLGHEIGRGGEGAVFEVATTPEVVAKIYHHILNREKAEKICLMAALRNDRVSKLAAWPLDLLLKRTADPIGLLMPRITGRKDIHHLYSPKSRRNEFLRADWRFLLRAAGNTARAFAVVHETGCVIGDVNHGGVLVAQDATVRLIDCDSFQVISNGRKFLCEVGVETFTPPELQGRSFTGSVRSVNHDNFGLAVMIFLLLFMGRHPFSGRFLGHGEMPLSKAIQECRFAYGARQGAIQMERPPGTPPLAIVGREVGLLFERAFGHDTISGGRPTARDWAAVLGWLEKQLKQCTADQSHWHLAALASCPWCAMEGATGVPLFPLIVQQAAGSSFDLDALWRQVLAVEPPGPPPKLSTPSVSPSSEARSIGRSMKAREVAGPIAAIAAVALGIIILPLPELWLILLGLGIGGYLGARASFDRSTEVERLRRKRDDVSSRWSVAKNDWKARAGPDRFDAKRRELNSLTEHWKLIPTLRIRKMDQLKADQRRLQLERFLDRFEIDAATIPSIGPGRKQTLESYGIETAADIQDPKLAAVPGFGPKLRSNLFAWRRSVERGFVFDPSRAIAPQDLANVEREVLMERRRIESAIMSALAELKRLRAQIVSTRQQLRPQMEAAQREHEQAAADYEAARG